MWREYFIPRSLEQAITLLAEHAGQARIIAGGTDLLVEFDRKTRPPCALIDISRLPELDQITLDEQGWLHLGPMVTHNDVVSSPLCAAYAQPLRQACWQVGAPQIRNRGTVAGNLITASPANDTITALMALDAVVTLRSTHGQRRVALSDFYTGVRKTVMRDDEMLVDIACRALSERHTGIFLKLGLRRAQAISVVNCAVVLAMDAHQQPIEARITLGAVAPTVLRARQAEQALLGRRLDQNTIDQAAALAAQAAQPIDDIRSSADYRREMVKVLVSRALRQLATGSHAKDEQTPVTLRTSAAPLPLPPSIDGSPLPIRTTVNGREYVVTNPETQHKTLLRLLREDCGLIGTKEGCSEGECGACTVILDGRAVMSCIVPAPRAHGATITTIEGVGLLSPAAREDGLHPLQQAFIEAGAVQCGYCTPGFIISGAALLCEHPQPTEARIKEALSGNLCRCTGYYSILAAFRRAIVHNG
jgi:xanthine dehydrogenase iron-sulfur cluster and FAD-binding subunit A